MFEDPRLPAVWLFNGNSS